MDLDVSKAEDQHGLAVLHNHRRRVLAILDVAEWETSIDEVQNRVYYQNHVACMRQWDMPEELDTFGGELLAAQQLGGFLFTELKSVRTIVFVPPSKHALSAGALHTLPRRASGGSASLGVGRPGVRRGACT